jgi:polysaccharide deacetylase family protein (PEP-CTERM system associated)
VLNALSVDVEEWFHNTFLGIDVDGRRRFESRVRAPTEHLLRLFERLQVRATFFVVGVLAESDPDLVRAIVDAGHEVASHGHQHRLVHDLSPREFEEDVTRSLDALSRAAPGEVAGFRAASWSIDARSAWALDVLARLGVRFDSSVLPARVPFLLGGMPDGAPRPSRIRPTLIEFPASVLSWAGLRLPFALGTCLRVLPLWLVRAGIRRLNERHRTPAMVSVHTWEFDDALPSMPPIGVGARLTRCALGRAERRLEALLGEFRFAPLGQVLGGLGDALTDPGGGHGR